MLLRVRELRSTATKCRTIGFVSTVLLFTFIVTTVNKTDELLLSVTIQNKSEMNNSASTIDTEGCIIPKLPTFIPSINGLMDHYKIKPLCVADTSVLIYNETHVWIRKNMENVENDKDSIRCCFKPFYRPVSIRDIRSSEIDHRVDYLPCIYFNDIIESKHEFARVTCTLKNKIVDDKYFLFAVRKPFSVNNKNNHKQLHKDSETYNVIIMAVDSISRLNFHRTMPKTLAFVKSRDTVELFGYNKIGDNTFPNLVPVLLGVEEEELKFTCWPSAQKTFDNCPMLWDKYKEAGYYTAFGEDSGIGLFNQYKLGFYGTPTDYYLHTFMVETNLKAATVNTMCLGDRFYFKILLDYVESLTSVLKESRLFAFFMESTMTHDYISAPMAMDNAYEEFFRNLAGKEYLNDTVLVLMSDHGLRFGEFRRTAQGHIEERLPMMYFVLPQSFKIKFKLAYENLHVNRHRLTTPLDIYATLKDLVDLTTISDMQIKRRSKENYAAKRGISLFLTIPGNRTCKSAGIDEHWCSCLRSVRKSVTSAEAMEVAEGLLLEINSKLHNFPQCSRLQIAQIVNIEEMSVSMEGETIWREYSLILRTKPGGAIFEATMSKDSDEAANTWLISGSISRIDMYGEQSSCVNEPEIKLYCYCEA